MASEEMGLFSAQRLDNGLNPHPQLVFPESFSCGPPPPPPRRDSAAAPAASASAVGDPGPKTTRELTGFLDHHNYFRPQPQQATEFRGGSVFADRRDCHNWNTSSRASTTPSGDGSEDDEDDDDEDDNEDENEAEGRALVVSHNNNSKVNNNSDKVGNQKPKDIPNFGSTVADEARNAVTIADANGTIYYSQYLQGTGVSSGQKDIVVIDNGCGFSGRKESSYSSESGESLRAILSDPITGALMDDGVILPCGHSFGNGGVEHIIRTKACYSCAQPVSEDSVAPNLSLRAAVQAFRREEELQVNRPPKRRKERPEQEKGTSGDSMLGDHPRRGVQFPFVVTDRVIIKGNKRTPLRFVGREAVVTTQCLNGWYVVKTLDNAESVKLQYRSLAKAPDRSSSQTISSSKTANWL
ncbi:PREDICTED: U-box domain-containing protein 62-like [Ipomoea nil]|uniref:U-box domain-containing protein 62-like n=1 Tax=Ipomoea nil TaxID=35883 RepID=UPI00090166BC|nr:PREDICTED: U-box domain-containing protein 62-like [Ipomoea nil]